jgi:hypothetical protein
MNSSVSSWIRLPEKSAPTLPRPFYTADDLAQLLQVPRKTIYTLGIPEVRPAPRTIRYVPPDVSRWLDERRGYGSVSTR